MKVLRKQLKDAGIPTVGISSGVSLIDGEIPTVDTIRIDYASEATAEQRAAGEVIRQAFSWLAEVKEKKIENLRRRASYLIDEDYPPHDRENAAIGQIASAPNIADVRAAIAVRISAFQAAKASVEAATTIAEVEAVTLAEE